LARRLILLVLPGTTETIVVVAPSEYTGRSAVVVPPWEKPLETFLLGEVVVDERVLIGATFNTAVAATLTVVELTFLLDIGFDVHRTDDDGNTLLHLVCAVHRDDLVAVLLARRSDPHARNHHGQTPLWRALLQATAGPYHTEVVTHAMNPRQTYVSLRQTTPRRLLQAGATLYAATEAWSTLLGAPDAVKRHFVWLVDTMRPTCTQYDEVAWVAAMNFLIYGEMYETRQGHDGLAISVWSPPTVVAVFPSGHQMPPFTVTTTHHTGTVTFGSDTACQVKIPGELSFRCSVSRTVDSLFVLQHTEPSFGVTVFADGCALERSILRVPMTRRPVLLTFAHVGMYKTRTLVMVAPSEHAGDDPKAVPLWTDYDQLLGYLQDPMTRCRLNTSNIVFMLAAGLDINRTDDVGNTVLHTLCEEDTWDVLGSIEVVLGHCHVNAMNHRRQTPLWFALANHRWPVVRVLLVAGAVIGYAMDADARAFFATDTMAAQDTMRDLVYQVDTGDDTPHTERAARIMATLPLVRQIAHIVLEYDASTWSATMDRLIYGARITTHG
jgi:hypothetical protein